MWFHHVLQYVIHELTGIFPYVTFLHYCIMLCNKSMICDCTMLCNLQFLNLQEHIHMLVFCIITSYCAIHQWYVIAPYCVICNSWIYSNIDYVSWQLQQQQMQNANLQMQITYCMIASYVAMNRWCYDISPCSAICYYEFTGIFL